MQHIDYIEAQAQLAKTMRQVCESEQPIAIDGAGKDRVVMLPMEVFKKLNSSAACKPCSELSENKETIANK